MKNLIVGLMLVFVVISEANAQHVQFQSNNLGGAMQPPMTGPIVPPNIEGWQHGWRETYTHEWRPLNQWDNHVRSDGAYMNNAGCWQRDLPVYSQAQPAYCYPQYQVQPQYCVPQYQYVKPRTCWPW